MTAGRTLAAADGVYLAVGNIALLQEASYLPADRPDGRPWPAWRAAEHRATRVLLRGLLAEVAGPAATGAAVTPGLNGKPALAGCPHVGISMSHTEGWAAAAVSTRNAVVGIDVQAPVPASDALARRCCAAEVADDLACLNQAARNLEMAWIWSVQEACVKATGAGLAGRPWAIPVGRGQRAGQWGNISWRALREHFEVPVSCAYQAG